MAETLPLAWVGSAACQLTGSTGYSLADILPPLVSLPAAAYTYFGGRTDHCIARAKREIGR